MSINLRKRINKDGSTTLIMDIRHGGKRHYEFLSDLKLPAGSSPVDRQVKKENMELAKKIVIARSQELAASDYNIETDRAKNVSVTAFMKNYVANYDKADGRVITSVVNKFASFLAEKKMSGLIMRDFSENIALQFRDRLKKDLIGEGPKSYYNRFRKVVRQAYRERLLPRNPCEFVPTPRGEARAKDILTPEELQLVAQTPTEAIQVKRAYLYSTQTGLRFCDCKVLPWGAVDILNRKMKVVQLKTSKEVLIPLNATAIALLGEPGKPEELVFKLGSSNGCNKSLDALVKRAGINKKIRFHSARHFCGTELTRSGSGLLTVMNVLGQSSLQMAKRYVQACSVQNQEAVDKMPVINL